MINIIKINLPIIFLILSIIFFYIKGNVFNLTKHKTNLLIFIWILFWTIEYWIFGANSFVRNQQIAMKIAGKMGVAGESYRGDPAFGGWGDWREDLGAWQDEGDKVPDHITDYYDKIGVFGDVSRDEIEDIIKYRSIEARNQAVQQYKADYGKTIICGTATLGGYNIGIVANQKIVQKSNKGEMQMGGVIYSDSADKAARFVMNCNQDKIPILFIHDVNGFMAGKDAEWGGIAKDGAKLVNAVANSVVPKITLILGGSYGAGN